MLENNVGGVGYLTYSIVHFMGLSMPCFPGHRGVPLEASPDFVQPVLVQKAVLQIFLATQLMLLAQIQFLVSKSVTTMQDVCLFESSTFIVLLLLSFYYFVTAHANPALPRSIQALVCTVSVSRGNVCAIPFSSHSALPLTIDQGISLSC